MRGAKSGLSSAWQQAILRTLTRARQPLTLGTIAARVHEPGYPRTSSLRVTLWWLVREGRVRRIRPGVFQAQKKGENHG